MAEIRKITGDGVRFSLETSAQPAVLREAIEALMPAGTCVLLGSARSGTEVSFEMPFLQFGRVVRGIIQGESHPQEFIPKLVDFLMQGKMPVDRMMTFYPLLDINQAARDLSDRDNHQADPAHDALISRPERGGTMQGWSAHALRRGLPSGASATSATRSCPAHVIPCGTPPLRSVSGHAG